MRLSLRLLLGYFLIVGVAAWFVLDVFVAEVKPGVRQTQEDSLVDTAHLLAGFARDDLLAGRLADGDFAREVLRYTQQAPKARIWGFPKDAPGCRILVTDARGIVRFDSAQQAVGQDYSRWNDVYLTLRGRYGVRTSGEDPAHPEWTVMHVAAPIRAAGKIVGVLTVAKPNRLVEPFIRRSEDKIRRAGWVLLAISLLIGLAVVLGLHHNLSRLEAYAAAVSRGERAGLPELSVKELRHLGQALEAMRHRLEGRQYVEQYVTTLTHEMKSPLTAVQGAAELLDDPDMPAADRQRFLAHIRQQVERLRQFIDRMLALATVEHRRQLEQTAPVDLAALLHTVAEAAAPRLARRGLGVRVEANASAQVQGDAFLLRQALENLLENAIDFSPSGGTIDLTLDAAHGTLRVRDAGPGIPDYAIQRVFERGYSLPRPDGRPKSTGLGLAFVREVAHLHGGTVSLQNHPAGGAEAQLCLPLLPRA